MQGNEYHIILVPKLLCQFEEMLELLGLFGVIKLHSFQWFPINLDDCVLSLELPSIYKDLFVYHDLSFLSIYAKSLWQLFFVIGKPKFVLSLGNFSNMVLKQLDIFCNSLGDTDKPNSDVSGLLIFDRNIDYSSALLTPATYTALLNEISNIKCGMFEIKEEESFKNLDEKCNVQIKKEKLSFPLDGLHDRVYNDIKHHYFSEVTSVLSTLTKQLKTEGNLAKEMAINEIKKYVATQLQDITLKKKHISNHLQAAETVIKVLGNRFEKQRQIEVNMIQNKNKTTNYKYLEEVLSTENDKIASLRLICLMAVTQTLSETEINNLLYKYLLEFGFKYGYVYNNLRRALFVVNAPIESLSNKIVQLPKLLSNNFYSNATKLRQIPKDASKVDLKNPSCSSYVFGGCYVPFIAAVSNMLIYATPLKELQMKFEALGPLVVRNERYYPLQNRSLLICVVGGITYAEIAACNLLGKLTDSKITLLSDKIISGNNIIESLLEQIDDYKF